MAGMKRVIPIIRSMWGRERVSQKNTTMTRSFTFLTSCLRFVLVPKLQLGNSVREALASRLAKLELRHLGSQAGAWNQRNS